jgi:hypothetical protein
MSVVGDTRIDQTEAHALHDISLVLPDLAVFGGGDGMEDIELFGKIRLFWLNKFGGRHRNTAAKASQSRRKCSIKFQQ